ncbi:COMM domain-containing protein 4 [Nematostella vectensis]|uniref:COMM domain-containing protein 4 n=1 Tax=Nematostella vectensis TaxID=45351 RepID=UPI002076E2FD|nr:COMM domain-containing protein 4 [Nematostella vectensis]
MKFRFCGDLDCPDWVLAEISTLSKMSSIKMKLLCAQVVKDLLGETIDYAKVQKLTSDAKFEVSDVKAVIAALCFILSSAAKYTVDSDSLGNELQQLGLPKEHCGALCKVYAESLSPLQDRFRETSLKFDGICNLEWRVDYVLGSSELDDVKEPEIQLKFNKGSPDGEVVAFTVTSDKFRVLLAELKQAQSFMEGLS